MNNKNGIIKWSIKVRFLFCYFFSHFFGNVVKKGKLIFIWLVIQLWQSIAPLDIRLQAGEMKLPLFFSDNVTIYNAAVSGSSTKRFRDKLKWKAVYDSLKKGDYLFIQFGHNDEEKDKPAVYTDAGGAYNENLKRYINEAKDKGVIPILLTSIRRRKFDENGKLLDTHGKYPAEMSKVAKEINVPLIDLTKMSKPMIEGFGVEGSKKLFRWVKPGEYPAYPDGREDNTHFSPLGAMEVCKLVVKGIKDLDIGLKEYLVIPKK